MAYKHKEIITIVAVMLVVYLLAAGFLYLYSQQIVKPPTEEAIVDSRDKTDKLLDNYTDSSFAITDRVVMRSYCRKADMVAALGAEEQNQLRRLVDPEYDTKSRIALDRIQSTLIIVDRELKQDVRYLQTAGYRLPNKDECRYIMRYQY
jgi:hypothetical protein